MSRRQIATAVAAGLGSASPPYVSIKGNMFTLVDASGEQEPIKGDLDCVIFDVNMDVPIQRVFWGVDDAGRPKPYDPSADSYQAPLCFSDNGIGASVNAAQPQSANCASCKWSTWGSAVSKMTNKPIPACGRIKKVVVLVPGMEIPFLLRVPIMSHENLRVYSSKFKGQDFDVSEVITRISFVHGQVGQIDFTAVSRIDDATDKLIDRILASKVTDQLLGRSDVPVTAQLAASGAQQALPQGAPPQPPVQQQIPAQPAPLPQPASPQPRAEEVIQQQPTPSPKSPRKPRKAAEPASSPFANNGAAPAADDSGIPPFLRRSAEPAAQAPSAQQPQSENPAHGIVTNAPAPNADLQAALDNVFGLK